MRSLHSFVVLFSLFLLPTVVIGADYTLEELRLRLAEEITSVQALQVSFEAWSDKPRGPYKSKVPVKRDWAFDAGKVLLYQHPVFLKEQGKTSISWETFDGEKTHRVFMDPDNPTQMKRIDRIAERIPFTSGRPYPAHVYGMDVRYLDTNLPSMMNQTQAAYEGDDAINGVQCPRILLGTHDSPRSLDYEYRVWLDPQHSYLPVKSMIILKYREKPGVVVEGPKTGHFGWQVMKFAEFDDRLQNRKRWFPVEAELDENGHSSKVRATSVIFNEPIPMVRFRPEPQPGTTIVELKHEGDMTPAQAMGGGKAAVEARRKELISQVAERKVKAALTGPKVDATPKPPSWPGILTWVSFAIVFGLGGFYLGSKMVGS